MKGPIFTLPSRSDLDHLCEPVQGLTIIDVLRASTTAAFALQAGARAIIPGASRDEARRIQARLKEQGIEPLLCGEREGRKIEGFDLGNSPREFTPERVQGATLIMATTNGAKALRSAEKHLRGPASWIAFAAYVNARLAARAHRFDRGRNCPGLLGQVRPVLPGDFVGAGLIVHELLQMTGPEGWRLDDASRAALDLYDRHRNSLQELLPTCSHGAYLIECGFGDDLPLCAGVNTMDCLPLWREGELVKGHAHLPSP
jgi:2-phosphosulfolactate phosphatase